jgi:hypothetical protein
MRVLTSRAAAAGRCMSRIDRIPFEGSPAVLSGGWAHEYLPQPFTLAEPLR